jgi:hypothetical protein
MLNAVFSLTVYFYLLRAYSFNIPQTFTEIF